MRKTRITLDTIDVLRPVILARQTPEGWSFARLVKPRVKPSGSQPIVFAIDTLRLYDGKKRITTVTLKAKRRGTVSVRLPRLSVGKHKLKVVYSGTKQIAKRTSKVVVLRVTR
jgi:hypothetical protein